MNEYNKCVVNISRDIICTRGTHGCAVYHGIDIEPFYECRKHGILTGKGPHCPLCAIYALTMPMQEKVIPLTSLEWAKQNRPKFLEYAEKYNNNLTLDDCLELANAFGNAIHQYDQATIDALENKLKEFHR